MLFPKSLLDRLEIINYHAGPPGPHALSGAIERGDKTIRCFWHWIDEGIDTGPVLAEKTVNLPQDFAKAHKLIIETGVKLYENCNYWEH